MSKNCKKWKLNPYKHPKSGEKLSTDDKEFKSLLKKCKSEEMSKEDCVFFDITKINPLTNRKISSEKTISKIQKDCKKLSSPKKVSPKKSSPKKVSSKKPYPKKVAKCQAILKSGERKGKKCGLTVKEDIYCGKHIAMMKRKSQEKIPSPVKPVVKEKSPEKIPSPVKPVVKESSPEKIPSPYSKTKLRFNLDVKSEEELNKLVDKLVGDVDNITLRNFVKEELLVNLSEIKNKYLKIYNEKGIFYVHYNQKIQEVLLKLEEQLLHNLENLNHVFDEDLTSEEFIRYYKLWIECEYISTVIIHRTYIQSYMDKSLEIEFKKLPQIQNLIFGIVKKVLNLVQTKHKMFYERYKEEKNIDDIMEIKLKEIENLELKDVDWISSFNEFEEDVEKNNYEIWILNHMFEIIKDFYYRTMFERFKEEVRKLNKKLQNIKSPEDFAVFHDRWNLCEYVLNEKLDMYFKKHKTIMPKDYPELFYEFKELTQNMVNAGIEIQTKRLNTLEPMLDELKNKDIKNYDDYLEAMDKLESILQKKITYLKNFPRNIKNRIKEYEKNLNSVEKEFSYKLLLIEPIVLYQNIFNIDYEDIKEFNRRIRELVKSNTKYSSEKFNTFKNYENQLYTISNATMYFLFIIRQFFDKYIYREDTHNHMSIVEYSKTKEYKDKILEDKDYVFSNEKYLENLFSIQQNIFKSNPNVFLCPIFSANIYVSLFQHFKIRNVFDINMNYGERMTACAAYNIPYYGINPRKDLDFNPLVNLLSKNIKNTQLKVINKPLYYTSKEDFDNYDFDAMITSFNVRKSEKLPVFQKRVIEDLNSCYDYIYKGGFLMFSFNIPKVEKYIEKILDKIRFKYVGYVLVQYFDFKIPIWIFQK